MGSAEPQSTEGLLSSHLVQEEETKKPLSYLPSLCSSSFGSVLTQVKGSCPAEHVPQSLLGDSSGEYVCGVGGRGLQEGQSAGLPVTSASDEAQLKLKGLELRIRKKILVEKVKRN